MNVEASKPDKYVTWEIKNVSKSPDELFQERQKRVNDAIQLKVPDRVPVMVHSGFFPAFYSGISCEEAMYDADKAAMASTRFLQDFQPDVSDNPFGLRFIGAILEALDCKQLKWAGHGLDSDASYQFVEAEYMKAEEYDQFIFDPTDFLIRVYWPRIFGALKPFEKLPSFRDVISYYMGITKFGAFDSPAVRGAIEALLKAGEKANKLITASAAWAVRSRELGFPAQAGSLTQAPFDTLSDFFRGTQGAMTDMYRRPEKIQEALEKILPIMLQLGLSAKNRGVPRTLIPLHKGLDGFMSAAQFKRFFWPTLKRLIEDLITEGCTPILFWEGNVASRLEIIADIPKGKAVYSFERTDMFRAKEVLGDVVCLQGNVPVSMLITGTPDDVRQYCKKLIDVVGKDGGFIMDSSAVIDKAKLENVKAMFEFTREYGVYR
jgi:uroporphyrinogen-III decarboxylase